MNEPTPEHPVIEITIDKPRRLRKTRRTSYRLSKMGFRADDLNTESKLLANICDMVAALIDEPNTQLTGEDVAEHIDGREREVTEAVMKLLDVSSAEKKMTQDSGNGPSTGGQSESAKANTGTARTHN